MKRDADEKKLWAELERLRARGEHVAFRALADIVGQDRANVTLEQVARFLGLQRPEAQVPSAVVRFVQQAARQASPATALDPSCGTGELLGAVVAASPRTRAVGFSLVAEDVLVLRRAAARISWHVGGSKDVGGLGRLFDMVVSYLPGGGTAQSTVVVTPRGSVHLEDDRAGRLLVASASHLAPKGQGWFVVAASSWSRTRPGTWRALLPSLDLSIGASLLVPAGNTSRGEAEPRVLVQIVRGPQQPVFVGELGDKQRTDTVFDHFAAGLNAPDARLGRLVELGGFRGVRALTASERLAELGRASGLEARALGQVALGLQVVERGEAAPAGSVVIASGQAGRPRAWLCESATDVAERSLVLRPDPALVSPAYLARYLGSALGAEGLDAVTDVTGALVDTDRDTLLSMPVYLPPLAQQERVLAVAASLREQRAELERAEERLWAKPLEVEQIDTEVTSRRPPPRG